MTDRPGDLTELEDRTRALLASDRVTAPTRAALQGRLDRSFAPADLLSPSQRRTLETVALRLIPEPALVRRTALVSAFEAKLGDGFGRGWRYADSPDDLALHAAGLDALDAAAQAHAERAFADIDPDAQDSLLAAACAGELKGAAAPPEHWFEELLTALTELFYAHPLVQVSIGYDGMADAGGIEAVGIAAVAAEAGRLDG